jgi:hypothetical protein
MQEHIFWSLWSRSLHRWGLREPAAVFLEVLGPLTFFLAQLVYLGQPLVGSSRSEQQWALLAHMLEDRRETQSFVTFLRQEGEA